MSTLPKPPVLPTQQVANYQNQALSGIGRGAITAAPTISVPQGGSPGSRALPTIQGRTDLISQGATAAGMGRLDALKRQAARTAAAEAAKAQAAAQAAQAALPAPGVGAPAGGGDTRGAYGLTTGAAGALARLQEAYQKQFGQGLNVLSGGRSHEEQARLYDGWMRRLPGFNLAAPPGKSVHESGNAVDFGGAAHGYGAQHDWLVANGSKYGWIWTGKNFSQVEPWHFEWQG